MPSLLLLLAQQVYRPHCRVSVSGVSHILIYSTSMLQVNAAISPSCRGSVDDSVTLSDLNITPILSSVFGDAVRWEKL